MIHNSATAEAGIAEADMFYLFGDRRSGAQIAAVATSSGDFCDSLLPRCAFLAFGYWTFLGVGGSLEAGIAPDTFVKAVIAAMSSASASSRSRSGRSYRFYH